MTPKQLRDLASMFIVKGQILSSGELSEHYRAHADALEELARVKKAISESCDEQRGEYFGCRRAERAEAALAASERKCERLKFHAEEMAEHIARYDEYARYDQVECLRAYRAEFKEE